MAKVNNLPEIPETVELNFKGFPLTCPFKNGHRILPVKTVCQIIDVDYQKQDSWLKAHPIFGQLYTLEVYSSADSKQRKMNCLSFFDAFGWLNSLQKKNRKEGSYEKQLAFIAWIREQIMSIYKDVDHLKFENEREVSMREEKAKKEEELLEIKNKEKLLKQEIKDLADGIEQLIINKYNGQIEMF